MNRRTPNIEKFLSKSTSQKISSDHLCKACRSAAVKFCPETVRGNRHGICREISGEILLLIFPQEMKLESAWDFSRQISRHFSPDALQLQMPNFMAFFILQTFVPEKSQTSESDSPLSGSDLFIELLFSCGIPFQSRHSLKNKQRPCRSVLLPSYFLPPPQ